MFRYKVRPSRLRFLAPLLISLVAVALFLPFYWSMLALCARFPAVPDCMPESMQYISWFFMAMFCWGIALSVYRAYKDFCKGETRALRLHT